MTKRILLTAGVLFAAQSILWADPVPYEWQTSNGDYTISTAEQLVSLANHVPSGGFSSSTFEGSGYAIRNLTVEGGSSRSPSHG